MVCMQYGSEYREELAKRKGFANRREHRDFQAQERGFLDQNEENRVKSWNDGYVTPMSENKDCTAYFGEWIANNYVSKIFVDINIMPYGNSGYNWICKNGLKIDHKASCLIRKREVIGEFKTWLGWVGWTFAIKHNNIADIFILSGWDNRDSMTPLFVWALRSHDIIRGKEFWERQSLSVSFSSKGLGEFRFYQIDNKLEKLKRICDSVY